MARSGDARVSRTIPLMLIVVILCPIANGNIIYVDDDANGANDGTSWENAYTYLQDALADADNANKPVEIRVAQGIYKPDLGGGNVPGDREAAFKLINGVTLAGGYAGIDANGPNTRDIELYETILSGDLNGDDVEVTDLKDLPYEPNRVENSYHVVTSYQNDNTAVIEGITVTVGNANGRLSDRDLGGGMYISLGSPTVLNCIFNRNSASDDGGGMYINLGSPTVLNCIFNRNSASGGGGMYNYYSEPTIKNCTFIGNSAQYGGGGIYNTNNSDAVLTNCTFSNNSAYEGGGIYNYDTDMKLSDCEFRSNSAGSGAGLYNIYSSLIIDDSMFSNNKAWEGGGMFNRKSKLNIDNCMFSGNSAGLDGGGIRNDYGNNSNLTNCIFSGNSSIERGGGIWNEGGELTLTNCTLSGNWAHYTSFDRGKPVGYSGGGIYDVFGDGTILTNCILWSNIPNQIIGSADVSYSNIEGGWPEGGIGIIDTDPCFANAGYWDPNSTWSKHDDFWVEGDYHLKSQAGRWTLTSPNAPDTNSQTWIIDDVTSPCIDAGNPNNPVGDEPEPNGGRINMGAYGGTQQASRSHIEADNVQYQAYNPNPADGADEIDLLPILKWSAGLNAVSHNVYFGPNSPPPFKISQIETEFYPDPNTLEPDTTYYWRIDEIDNKGRTIVGVNWTFTTYGFAKANCFPGQTLVSINNALVPISKLEFHQNVDCIDRSSVIEDIQEHEGTFICYDILLESGNYISVADNHYFMTKSGRWISLLNLRAGVKLQTSKGFVRIINITEHPVPYFGKVYNLKIKDSDQYCVGQDAIIVRDY